MKNELRDVADTVGNHRIEAMCFSQMMLLRMKVHDISLKIFHET